MLRYLINLDEDPGLDGYETELGYDATRPPSKGVGIKYCNLRDQESPEELRKENKGNFGPYLTIPNDDILGGYDEPAPSPDGEGFWKLLRKQLDTAKEQGFNYVELDNLDTYSASVCLLAFNEVASRGLKLYAKNVGMVKGDQRALLTHPAVVAQIVERGESSTPSFYDNLRKQANKPELPTYFVAREGERQWADSMAHQIKIEKIPNMGVSYSDKGEYGSAIIILYPSTSSSSMPTTVTGADIIAKAKSYIGKFTDGSDVPKLAQYIGQVYPEMSGYAALAKSDTPWCAIFVAYVLTQLGIRPPYIKNTSDIDDWMWADAPLEAHWGTVVSREQAQPGDIMVLRSPHHQTIFDTNDGDYFYGVGGNQGAGVVSRARFAWSGVRAVVRPPIASAAPVPIVIDPATAPILREGDVGPYVVEAQKRLGVDADGEFGPNTRVAVQALQSVKGLDVDGEIGPKTWAALLGTSGTVQPVKSGKGSWYSQYDGKYHWVDTGDKPNSNALGVPDSAQGVSFYNQSTLGTWFKVTAPNGVSSVEQQTDIGPSPSTGRLIDISAAAAERFGYSPTNFPTDGVFKWQQIAVPSVVAGLSKQQQATKYRDLRGSIQPDPEPEPEPEPDPNPEPQPDPEPITIQEAITNVQKSLDNTQRALDKLKELTMATNQTNQIDWGAILQPILKDILPQIMPTLLPLVVKYLPTLLPVLLQLLFQGKTATQPVVSSNLTKPVVAGAAGGSVATAIISAIVYALIHGAGQ